MPIMNTLLKKQPEKVDPAKFTKFHPADDYYLPRRYWNVQGVGHDKQGYVTVARDSVTNRDVVIKKLRLLDVKHATRAYRELKFLSSFNNRNVINLVGAYSPQTLSTNFDVYVITPHFNTKLSSLINNDDVYFSHERVASSIHQILSGLNFLHNANIIHRGLKPSSIVVDTDGTLKLSDFGLARIQIDDSMTMCPNKDHQYRAPELLLETHYDSKVDIWSVGCIMFEMFTGRVMFKGKDKVDQVKRIKKKLGPFVKEEKEKKWFLFRVKTTNFRVNWNEIIPSNAFPEPKKELDLTTKNAREVIERMLALEPTDRFDVKQVLKCSYFGSLKSDNVVGHQVSVPKKDEPEMSLSVWKEKIFDEVKQCEHDYNVFASNEDDSGSYVTIGDQWPRKSNESDE